MKFNYGKTFLLGFGFFGVSVIWMIYNAFVPLFLANKFNLAPALIGFFMTLDNIAALLHPAAGGGLVRPAAHPHRAAHALHPDRRADRGAGLRADPAGGGAAAVRGLHQHPAAEHGLLAHPGGGLDARYHPLANPLAGQRHHQLHGRDRLDHRHAGRRQAVRDQPGLPLLAGFGAGDRGRAAGVCLHQGTANTAQRDQGGRRREKIAGADRREMWEAFASVVKDKDKSALRILLAIFFWFVAYNAIEAFFTLYAQNHLGLPGGDGAQLLGQLSVLFVLFALPAGYIGARFGRRRTIMTGIVAHGLADAADVLLPVETLIDPGHQSGPAWDRSIPSASILMLAGASWALINVNSLPMVVDMTDDVRIGTYTGLYYLFSTLAAIAGPNINGLLIQFTGKNYGMIMLIGPIFMALALAMMLGVRRGEGPRSSRREETGNVIVRPLQFRVLH